MTAFKLITSSWVQVWTRARSSHLKAVPRPSLYAVTAAYCSLSLIPSLIPGNALWFLRILGSSDEGNNEGDQAVCSEIKYIFMKESELSVVDSRTPHLVTAKVGMSKSEHREHIK